MKRFNKVIILFLSAVFLFAAADKTLHYQSFVKALQSYVIVPRGFASLLAPPIIALEALVGSGLLLRMWRRPAALAAAVTLVMFSIILSINHFYGGPAVCGCWFTITLAKSSQMHIVQNLAMAALATCLWWEEHASLRIKTI
jgi:uncharacterized membrane protein YphA (DoxX/SURF4 family)